VGKCPDLACWMVDSDATTGGFYFYKLCINAYFPFLLSFIYVWGTYKGHYRYYLMF